MALNDTEIEIKFRVPERMFSEVQKKLNTIATLLGEETQDDDFFTPAHRNFTEPEFPYEWFRIRRTEAKASLDYKHLFPENAELTHYCDEFATGVNNPEAMRKILKALDFRHLVTVQKRRQSFSYQDSFEVALDIIHDLGYFIEIETVQDFGSVDAAREAILKFAEELGISEGHIEKAGYPLLMLRKKGLK